MMQGNTLIDPAIPAEFTYPVRKRADPLTDYEPGGVGVNDPSKGRNGYLWHTVYDATTGDVSVARDGADPVLIFNAPGVTELGLAFDQNMAPFIAFTHGTTASYRYFDTDANAYAIADLPDGSVHPRCCMDDSRALEVASSDIILAYTRGGDLYFRQQRDKFQTEYLLKANTGGTMECVGPARNLRLQFKLTPTGG